MSYTIKRIPTSLDLRSPRLDQKKQFKLALIATIALLILISTYTFLSVSTSKSYEKFVENLRVNNLTNAIIHLEAFDRVFKTKYSKFNSKDSDNLPTAQERKDFVISMIKVLGQISSTDRQEQRKALLTIKRILNNINKLTSGAKNSRYKLNIHRDYKTLVTNYKELRRKEIMIPIRKKENQNRIYQQSILSQDLANEFGLLLGIAPQTLRGPNDKTKFYEKGLLQGLPVLNDLPDDIKDLNQLKSEIEKLRGEVSLRGGEDTPELFKKRLEEIRAKCDVFSQQIERLTHETDDYSSDIKELEDNFMKASAKFVREAKDFLIEYVQPN